ncbi:MAG: DUF2017 family protein [Planctomycetota bacterium]|jgi:hypothetical protein
MSAPILTREEDGGLRFSNLAPWFVSVLLELPRLLEKDQDELVKERLYPAPTDDEDENEEWKRLVHPELFALLASARAIVVKDLGGLVPSEEADPLGTWTMLIVPEHVNAWISALNAARLAIGAGNEIEEEDMNDESPDVDAWDDKRVAVAKIHLLGWLQQMIIEDQAPPPPVIPDSLPPDVV